jgi:hypothetical protein
LDETLSADCRGRTQKSREASVIDRKVMILGLDDISDFNAVHSRKHDQADTPSTSSL